MVGSYSCFTAQYEKADQVYEVHENYQPFAIAAECVIDLALKWRAAHKLDWLPLKYFFESGDAHWGQMSDNIERRFGVPPIPGEKKEPPFQAADFIAYEARCAYMELEVKDTRIWQKFRKSFLFWGQLPSVWGTVSEVGIRTEMNLRNVPKRKK